MLGGYEIAYCPVDEGDVLVHRVHQCPPLHSQNSKVLKRTGVAGRDPYYFSIHSIDRSLDLECQTPNETRYWSQVCHSHFPFLIFFQGSESLFLAEPHVKMDVLTFMYLGTLW